MDLGFVTWHPGRCGSSVLGSLLNQHSQVESANEVFSRYMPRRWGDRPVPAMDAVLKQAVASAQKPVLNIEIKSLSAQNRSLYPQQELEAWFACVSQHGFRRHLILHRRNGLRRLVSHLLAQRSGVFVQTIAMPQVPVQPLQVETSAIREGAETHGLIDWLRLYETTHRELCEQLERFCSASNLMLPLQLVYEDHIERAPTVAYERVCGWLGVEPEPVELQHRRINSQPLSQVIANWDEIQQLVQPTPYAWMLAA